jgi:hypothetical protein
VQKSKITARIPHQSPPNGGDSFPPGEAKGAAAPVPQTTIYLNSIMKCLWINPVNITTHFVVFYNPGRHNFSTLSTAFSTGKNEKSLGNP